jgi:uncharacterized protein YjbI with pentapeptide repeats
MGSALKLRSPAGLMALGVVATLVLALLVVMALALTGGTTAVSDNAALIGALVALGGVFTAQMVSIALEQQRSRETRELEGRRANEAAVRRYLEDVGKLLIEKSLRQARPGDNLSTVVQAQTLTVLEGLDPDHKRILLLFLSQSGLVRTNNPRQAIDRLARLPSTEKPIVELSGADLRGAGLRGANLNSTDLSGAYLSGANLSKAVLINAALVNADLTGADLSGATLIGAVFFGSFLHGADLSEAHMRGARLVGARGITNEEVTRRRHHAQRPEVRGLAERQRAQGGWSRQISSARIVLCTHAA